MSVATVAQQATEVRLLSGFVVNHRGAALDLSPATQRLVAFLALIDRAVERKYAAFKLWPEKGEDRAMANLRSALWRLRQLQVPLVHSSTSFLSLDSSVWVDTRQEAGADGSVESMFDDRSLAGELLPDWYDEWLVIERERLRQSRLHLLDFTCCELLEKERVADAIDLALRAVSLEPLRESAHRIVISGHLAEGNVVEAVRHYRAFRAVLREELGVEPSVVMRDLLPAGCREG